MNRALLLTVFAAAACAMSTAAATEQGPQDQAYPDDHGVKLLAAACNSCHGPDGRGSEALPALEGRQDIGPQLTAWQQSNEAKGPQHLMIRLARALTDQNIEALHHHYRRAADP